MSPATQIASIVASVNTDYPTTQKKLLSFYPVVVHYLLKIFAIYLIIVEIDPANLCYTQPPNITFMQYAADLYAKLSKVADIYEDPALNDIFIVGVDYSVCRGLLEY